MTREETKVEMLVYLLGVVALGLVYEPIKKGIDDDWMVVGICVVYLVFLRLLGKFIAGGGVARVLKRFRSKV